mmetsp:Transcript_14498/g.38777  ORF Transcript_14498/g.38777 Transcript_14498/m.38777 type:complete len:89 (-) Transcript_14498:1098-1364(-)
MSYWTVHGGGDGSERSTVSPRRGAMRDVWASMLNKDGMLASESARGLRLSLARKKTLQCAPLARARTPLARRSAAECVIVPIIYGWDC